ETLWLMDSGASKHFTYKIEDFYTYSSFQEPLTVKTANKNAKTFMYGIGTIQLNHR
ncbi:hypothetical protein M378DRAFT_54255, partial [Amanita muscaria Koide BX008]